MMRKTSKSQTLAPVALQAVVIPCSVKLMLEKYNKNYAHHPPHERKRLEVACVIQATGIERLAQELEELARTLREGGVGYMGSGGGYYMTLAYAVTKRHNDMNKPETPEANQERPPALAGAPGSASGLRPPDCAAIGGPTISRMRGCINDEMKECIICGNVCRWDMAEHSFFGFAAVCPQKPNQKLSD